NLTSDRLDAFVLKLDPAGNLLWAKQLGGTGHGAASGVAVDGAGADYTVGYFQLTADFDPGPGTANLTAPGPFATDAVVSEADDAGNFVWAKRLGGAGEDVANGVAVDASGAVLTTGSFDGTADFDPAPGTFYLSNSGGSAYVSKLDAAGNFVWAK